MKDITVPPAALLVVLLLFGFLTGSTFYFYNRTRQLETKTVSTKTTTFTGDIPAPTPDVQSTAVDQLTKPAEPKNRLSYPANIYTVQPKETLFAVGAKFSMTWQLIQQANGLTNENVIQAGSLLAIPKLSKETDNYRINFLINDLKAADLNKQLKDKDSDPQFDPVAVAKASVEPYFGLTSSDSFTLAQADYSQGVAAVSVKKGDKAYVIGLIQPKIKGQKGFWALLYVERED